MGQNFNQNQIIVKRTGQQVPFDRVRILNAIVAAVDAIESKASKELLDDVVNDVCYEISVKFTNFTPNVENIQDLVEKNLMKYELFDVAKAYILYRANRSEARESEPKEPVKEEGRVMLKINCDQSKVGLIMELVSSIKNGQIELTKESE